MLAKMETEEVDEDALIEERRRKRQELLARLQRDQEAAGAFLDPCVA